MNSFLFPVYSPEVFKGSCASGNVPVPVCTSRFGIDVGTVLFLPFFLRKYGIGELEKLRKLS
jgi:hypothetical protein